MKKSHLLLSILILLATLGATLLVYQHLPEQVPVHWNVDGEVDRYGSRAHLFILPAVLAFTIGLWLVLPRLSPQKFTVESFQETWSFTNLVVTGLLAYLQFVALWGAYTGTMLMGQALLGGLAVFSILMGNVIGKVKRNFWLGIRTPWALANDRVWYATHRLAAKTMVVAGIAGLAVLAAGLHPALGIGLVAAGMLLPAVWSLLYYKRLERDGRLNA